MRISDLRGYTITNVTADDRGNTVVHLAGPDYEETAIRIGPMLYDKYGNCLDDEPLPPTDEGGLRR